MRKIWGILIISLSVLLLAGCLEKLTMQKITDRFSEDHIFIAPTVRELQELNQKLVDLGCEECRVSNTMDIQGEGHICDLLVYEFRTISDAENFYRFYLNQMPEEEKHHSMIRRRDQFVFMSDSEDAIKRAIR